MTRTDLETQRLMVFQNYDLLRVLIPQKEGGSMQQAEERITNLLQKSKVKNGNPDSCSLPQIVVLNHALSSLINQLLELPPFEFVSSETP